MCGSVGDLRSKRLYTSLLAEFIGTLLLVFVGCGSCSTVGPDKATVVQISLCFGLSVATIVWTICNVSGGHINPAVTAGMFITRKISLIRAVFYIGAQSLGAIIGAGLLKTFTPAGINTGLGMTALRTTDATVTLPQGVGIEMVITFVLVFTVFASCDGLRSDIKGSAPLAIGLSVTMCHLFAVPFTGSSMNPARTLGPAVVGTGLTMTWTTVLVVYWAAPIIGGMLAALVYDVLFAVNSTPAKLRGMLMPTYDDSSFDQSGRVKKAEDVVEEDDLKEAP